MSILAKMHLLAMEGHSPLHPVCVGKAIWQCNLL